MNSFLLDLRDMLEVSCRKEMPPGALAGQRQRLCDSTMIIVPAFSIRLTSAVSRVAVRVSPEEAMQRRHFIHLATLTAVFTGAAKPCAPALAAFSRNRDRVFFDQRFPTARGVAALWPAFDPLMAVEGDITPFWGNGLDRMTRERALLLSGVTTDSFLFCLRTLAAEHADLDGRVSRLDRNLLAWTIYTVPNPRAEARHG